MVDKVELLSQQMTGTHIVSPVVESLSDIDTPNDVVCNEPLDAVKSLPEFTGVQEKYASWRRATLMAYRVFRPHYGTARHYQAVIIIRHKVTGTANDELVSFDTALNVDAIISRLDFAYSDNRTIHVIEQELATLRQNSAPLLKYYDKVCKKLTLLTNKVNMSYEPALAKTLCEKFREYAPRVFVSGLTRSLLLLQPRALCS